MDKSKKRVQLQSQILPITPTVSSSSSSSSSSSYSFLTAPDERQPRTMSTPSHPIQRSPVRNSTQNPNPRLRNPSLNVGTGSQRRRSNEPGISALFNPGSTSTASSASGNFLDHQYSLSRTIARTSSSSGKSATPRTSIPMTPNHHRTKSLNSQPSTEELVDVMEREQDAIVMKLMKEINFLKEENRTLMNTVNHLTSGYGTYTLNAGSRSSLDSRRNSALGDEYEIGSLHSNGSRYNPLLGPLSTYPNSEKVGSRKK